MRRNRAWQEVPSVKNKLIEAVSVRIKVRDEHPRHIYYARDISHSCMGITVYGRIGKFREEQGKSMSRLPYHSTRIRTPIPNQSQVCLTGFMAKSGRHTALKKRLQLSAMSVSAYSSQSPDSDRFQNRTAPSSPAEIRQSPTPIRSS